MQVKGLFNTNFGQQYDSRSSLKQEGSISGVAPESSSVQLRQIRIYIYIYRLDTGKQERDLTLESFFDCDSYCV